MTTPGATKDEFVVSITAILFQFCDCTYLRSSQTHETLVTRLSFLALQQRWTPEWGVYGEAQITSYQSPSN